MPTNKKKEPKFLSFITQNFSANIKNKTNVKEKEPGCPINSLCQLLEPSSLAVPQSTLSFRTQKPKPCGQISRNKHLDINNMTGNISSGSNVIMNNTSVGSKHPVNVDHGSIINAPCKDSSGFAVPTMRAPRTQKNDANKLIEELREKAMRAWCILDEDICKKLLTIMIIEGLNLIELSGQDDASQHSVSDHDSINVLQELLTKLDETGSENMSSIGLTGPGFRDIDNVSSISGYNSIRQGPSHGRLDLSELGPGKPLLPRFMTIDASTVGLPSFNSYGYQNGMSRSNASVAVFPEQALSDRAMSVRMDGSFMSNRMDMDNASVYSAMPYTPAYNNRFSYRGGAGNNHHSNTYFSNRRLHSLMEDRENIPHSYNTDNMSCLDNMRRDQVLRHREYQPRVMLERLQYSDNGPFKVPSFSNSHGRMGSIQDFQRSYNHNPGLFDPSSSVRRILEENEDRQERCSNAPIQSEYRVNDSSNIRRMNGANEAVQENVGRLFDTRSQDLTMLRRFNDNMQEKIERPFDSRLKDSAMIRRLNEGAQEKVGPRLFENRSRDPLHLRRINCDDSLKENVPHQSNYRSRDLSMHRTMESNTRRIVSNSDRRVRDRSEENETHSSRPATRSATRLPTHSINKCATVYAPTPTAARNLNESHVVCVTRSGREVRAPQTFWSADMSYLSTAHNQSIRGKKRKRDRAFERKL